MIVVLVATKKKRIGSMKMWTLPNWITDGSGVFLLAMIVVYYYEVLLVPSKSSSSSRKTEQNNNDSAPFRSLLSPW
jgi:hypothetical protein|tara:strand:+ start:2157 stop:2384 length:228 start_codon:yes stop_codon:yes gene_type:complete